MCHSSQKIDCQASLYKFKLSHDRQYKLNEFNEIEKIETRILTAYPMFYLLHLLMRDVIVCPIFIIIYLLPMILALVWLEKYL